VVAAAPRSEQANYLLHFLSIGLGEERTKARTLTLYFTHKKTLILTEKVTRADAACRATLSVPADVLFGCENIGLRCGIFRERPMAEVGTTSRRARSDCCA